MNGLTDSQSQLLHENLLQLRNELLLSLDSSRASSATVDLEQPIGRLSRMDALQQQQMARANRADTERRLALTEAALLAVRQDCYGLCRRCEEPIGYRRLEATPETPFCLTCQGQLEKGR